MLKLPLDDLSIAQLVHDLRNQLTVIIGCGEEISRLVARGVADQEIQELLESSERASRLTRELLLSSRPRTRARGSVDLNDVVTPAAASLARVVGSRVLLRLRLAPGPIPVAADPIELERIVLNLALNAREAMQGSGELTIETAVETHPANEASHGAPQPSAVLTVTDTGRGMTPEIKARMFEPFFTTAKNGTGLGMSSVAYTVQQLRGMISVESRIGGGTSIKVHLPIAR